MKTFCPLNVAVNPWRGVSTRKTQMFSLDDAKKFKKLNFLTRENFAPNSRLSTWKSLLRARANVFSPEIHKILITYTFYRRKLSA